MFVIITPPLLTMLVGLLVMRSLDRNTIKASTCVGCLSILAFTMHLLGMPLEATQGAIVGIAACGIIWMFSSPSFEDDATLQ